MKRALVAGIGNVFLGDDGFGVAVAERLAKCSLPAGTRVVDFGIRGVHLAYELSEPIDFLILVDAAARDGAPGTLYVIDPEVDDNGARRPEPDAHAMDPHAVLFAAKRMWGHLPPTRIVACEPFALDEGVGLSDPVQRAIEPAIALITELLSKEVPEKAR